jgi:hypothetical protein
MPTPRLTELPDAVMRLIHKASGLVRDVGFLNTGRNSAIAARVRTTDHTLFVKGLPLDHPWVWTQKREADVNPSVRSIAPELHLHMEDDGWSLLGFEYVEGGHADFTPGSPHLPAVMDTMTRLAEVPAPNVELKTMPHRLRAYVDDPADLSWSAGNSLLHTEWNPHNVLVTDPEPCWSTGVGIDRRPLDRWALRLRPRGEACPSTLTVRPRPPLSRREPSLRPRGGSAVWSLTPRWPRRTPQPGSLRTERGSAPPTRCPGTSSCGAVSSARWPTRCPLRGPLSWRAAKADSKTATRTSRS